MQFKIIAVVLLSALCLGIWGSPSCFSESSEQLSIAIFEVNKTGQKEFTRLADQFKDDLTVALSESFSVVDRNNVINAFQGAKYKEKSFADEVLAVFSSQKDNSGSDIDGKSSVLRIGQNMGADLILIAELQNYSENRIKDVVYGNKINDLVMDLDVAIQVLDVQQGASVIGKILRVSKRLNGDSKSSFSKNDIESNLPVLLKEATLLIAKYCRESIEKIKSSVKEIAGVSFSISPNVDEVNVEVDGAVIGSAPGKFRLPAGLHYVRLTKEGYVSFERNVNISKGFDLSISMELSEDGINRENEKQDVKIKQGKADAEAYKTRKEGNAVESLGKKGKGNINIIDFE